MAEMEQGYIDSLIEKAQKAQKEFESYSQEQVDAIVKAMGKIIYDNAELIAKEAVEETGYGRVDSKILKITRCTTAAWHYLHDKKSVGMIDWDPVEKLATYAKPVGVVAALVPTTNPVSTTVSNGMSILKCRNAMIVSPHPRAKKTTIHGVELINEAIRAAGAPENLVQIVDQPSMAATSELMTKVDVVVATGGAPMVKSAYSSGRPSYGVGPGNVQVVVAPDWTDYDKLAKQVVGSRSYDNGMPCTGEQAIHLPADKVEQMKAAFVKQGAYILTDEDAKKLPGMLRREKLCPVVQFFPYENFEEGVSNAKSNLMWEGKGHSSVVYTNDEDCAKHAALELPVSRLLVNQPAGAASGGNFINGLVPTMSLGCGSWGNNSISDNLSYKHLMNTTKLAFYHDPTSPDAEKVWAE